MMASLPDSPPTSVDPPLARRAHASPERRRQVAQLVAEGLLDKQIAVALGISIGHVKRTITELADLWQLDRERNVRVQIAIRARETNVA